MYSTCSTDRYARSVQGLAMDLFEILSYQILSVSVCWMGEYVAPSVAGKSRYSDPHY